MSRITICFFFIAILLFLPLAAQDHRDQKFPPETYERAGRDEYQMPDKVVQALKLKPTDAVADIGAGSGYFTRRLAAAVPRGVVFAVDVDEAMLRHIHHYVEQQKQFNIVPVLSSFDDPMLPSDSVDVVFICNTNHHFKNRLTYYQRIGRILKKGGRLVIVDYEQKPIPVGPPADEKLSKEVVLKEAKASGFELAEELKFLPYQYYLIFRWPN